MSGLLTLAIGFGAMVRSGITRLFNVAQRYPLHAILAITLIGLFLTFNAWRNAEAEADGYQDIANGWRKEHMALIARVRQGRHEAKRRDLANVRRVRLQFAAEIERVNDENHDLRRRYADALDQRLRLAAERPTAKCPGSSGREDMPRLPDLSGGDLQTGERAIVLTTDLRICADNTARLISAQHAWLAAAAIDLNGATERPSESRELP